MNEKNKYKMFIETCSRWVFWGILIGIVIGSTTALLLKVNDYLGGLREDSLPWLVFLLPIGGLLIGQTYMKFGEDKAGNDIAKGNNLVIEAIHGKGQVLKRMGPIVYLGTFITVLFGGSTGREGAAVQMGASAAQTVNQFMKVSDSDRKILIMSGISAGFGAAFGTPITGAIFAMEVSSLGKMKYESFVPCVTSSFIGHYVLEAFWGVKHEKFIIEALPEKSLISSLTVITLAIVFSLVSVLYCQLRHGIQKKSEKMFKKNHMIRAFVGGVIIVVLTLLVGSQDYNGRGIEILQDSFTGEVPTFAFLGKLIFTAITLGTGFVGGEAIPLFFIGSTLGNTLSSFVDFPVSFLAALGLIATFCGGANTPIAAFILAIEMFNGKGIEFFFIACLVSYIFSGHHSLWPSQTIFDPKRRLYNVSKGESIAHIEKRKKE